MTEPVYFTFTYRKTRSWSRRYQRDLHFPYPPLWSTWPSVSWSHHIKCDLYGSPTTLNFKTWAFLSILLSRGEYFIYRSSKQRYVENRFLTTSKRIWIRGTLLLLLLLVPMSALANGPASEATTSQGVVLGIESYYDPEARQKKIVCNRTYCSNVASARTGLTPQILRTCKSIY